MRARAVAGAVLAATLASPAAAQHAHWVIDGGDVRVVVPLKPGGAFDAKSSALRGRLSVGSGAPLPLEGELSLDLDTIDTGIALRNEHLRENYLEVGRGDGYARAVLSELRLAEARGAEFTGRSEFTAILLLHNTLKQVSGSAELKRRGENVAVEARFILTLTDFGVTPPEYLGVGVGNKLIVNVSFTAAPAR